MTSNLVIAESYILILNELGHQATIHYLERIKTSPRILKIYSNEDLESEAEELLIKYSDQDFSYADAVSFAIMKREKIKKAFSFDGHFSTAGFINPVVALNSALGFIKPLPIEERPFNPCHLLDSLKKL